jgi:hypothetical protein
MDGMKKKSHEIYFSSVQQTKDNFRAILQNGEFVLWLMRDGAAVTSCLAKK